MSKNEVPVVDAGTEILVKKQMSLASAKFYDAFADTIMEMLYQGYKRNILHNPRLVMYKLMGTTINGITISKKHGRNIMGTINAMKYQGLVQNNWTIDTTRSIYEYNSFEDKAELMEYASRWFYLDRWKNQPTNILLICEASGYLGVIKHIADKFRVPYVPAKGDMSVQIKIELANSFTSHTDILYFGDYDKKGLQIPKTIADDIRAINPDAEFTLHRMFINETDIATYGLVPDADGSVQMEQLPEDIAIDTATDFIWSLMDENVWSETLEDEEHIKSEILEVA